MHGQPEGKTTSGYFESRRSKFCSSTGQDTNIVLFATNELKS